MFETNLRILLRAIFVNARFNRLLKCITIFWQKYNESKIKRSLFHKKMTIESSSEKGEERR